MEARSGPARAVARPRFSRGAASILAGLERRPVDQRFPTLRPWDAHALQLARSGVSASQRRQADGENQHAALEDRLEVSRRAENAEAIEADRENEHADQSAEDVKLPFPQG